MKTLLIDNDDSYTYNLYHLLAEINGEIPVLLRNDDPRLGSIADEIYDNIVISAGPGRPHSSRDIGHCMQVLRETRLPVLGVCLGHQALALDAGAQVVPAPRPRHGHLSPITHDGQGLFAGVPQGFFGVRYHSLCVAEPLPAELEATAWAEDGVVMALRHRNLPRWGVQFHPDSVATEYGRVLVENFYALTLASQPVGEIRCSRRLAKTSSRPRLPGPPAPVPTLDCAVRTLPLAVDAEQVYSEFYADRPYAFWLDSSKVEPGLSRFSFLGDCQGPLGEILTYHVADDDVLVERADGYRERESGDMFEVLRRRLAARVTAPVDLPFDFIGGYVGFFGYEMKARGAGRAHHKAQTPDAVWMFADRLVVIDHTEKLTYILGVHTPDAGGRLAAETWAEATVEALRLLSDTDRADRLGESGSPVPPELFELPTSQLDPAPWLVRDRAGYLADVAECQEKLMAGESYEICLTNKVRLPYVGDDLALYRRLRALNPAPYAALLRLGGVTIFSSSPERFLTIGLDGVVESKPIKGTAPRSADSEIDEGLRDALARSSKNRAENLMVVDLLRNDLGQVCSVGTVDVPEFMVIESYATVHQLVSTIRGHLRPDVSAVECVRKCFPGGSMTGAPKRRTVEILDSLETEARGVYSGALGYFSSNGAADLSIVIRTAVRVGNELTIGAGGAIVLDSDAVEEWEEMLLKVRATSRAITDHPVTTDLPM